MLFTYSQHYSWNHDFQLFIILLINYLRKNTDYLFLRFFNTFFVSRLWYRDFKMPTKNRDLKLTIVYKYKPT